MGRYLARRLLEMVPNTLGILLLTFALFHVVGGSPAQVVLGKNATAAQLAAFDAKYGYDKPLLIGHWAKTRALEDGAAAAAPGFRVPGSGFAVPFAFPLPAGTYRLGWRSVPESSPPFVTLVLRGLDGGAARTNRPPVAPAGTGAWRVTFAVPDGWQAAALELPGDGAPGLLRLRRRTAHLFDSQFFHFLGGLAVGDLGQSAEYAQPVWQVLRRGIGPSLAVTVPILLAGALVAVMFGLFCAIWRGQPVDRGVLLVSTLLMSINYVLWVLAGQYFLAFRLRLFPLWGFENWTYVLLPVLIGVLGGLGRDIRFYRAVILDEISRPYVRTAWAKGLSGTRIMVRHVLRNSLIPIVTYVSLSVPFLFTGSLLLESFYGIPGLGNVSLNAIHSADMAVVQAVVVIGALLYQIVTLLTDLCYGWLDPRVRLE
jgi:peptide/nickel transport system permease protein